MAPKFSSSSSSSPFKVQLKIIDPSQTTPTRDQIFSALQATGCYIVKLILNPEGAVLIAHSPSDLDKIFEPFSLAKFVKINLKPIRPESLQAERTVFVRGVDKSIGSLPPSEILGLLKEKHPQIVNLIPFPGRHTYFKCVCETTDAAVHLLNSGLKLGYQRIPPSDPAREVQVTLEICKR